MLSNDLQGIRLVFKALQDSSPWNYDMEILEIPWRKEKFDSILARKCDPSGTEANGRLVFGVLEDDGHVNPHPPVRIALQRVKQALSSCGYEVRGLQFSCLKQPNTTTDRPMEATVSERSSGEPCGSFKSQLAPYTAVCANVY